MSTAKQRHRRRRRRRLVWEHRGGSTGFFAVVYSGTNEGLVPRKYVVRDEAAIAANERLMDSAFRESPILRKIGEAMQ